MNEQRKVLQLLSERKVTVTKAESLLKQLQENKPMKSNSQFLLWVVIVKEPVLISH